MKKIVSFCIIGSSILFLAGCGNNSDDDNSSSYSSSTINVSSSTDSVSSDSSKPSTTMSSSSVSSTTIETAPTSINESESSTEISTSEQTTTSVEDEYYQAIKGAWEKQKEYINSIEDPNVKQSVQTPTGAATGEATRLQMENPEDSELIDNILKQVLNGN